MKRPWRGVACWLASPGLLIPPSYRTQDRQPRDSTTHHGLGPPAMVTKWEDVLQLNLMEAFPHQRLLSLITLAHVKLTYKTSQYSTLVSKSLFCCYRDTPWPRQLAYNFRSVAHYPPGGKQGSRHNAGEVDQSYILILGREGDMVLAWAFEPQILRPSVTHVLQQGHIS